YYMTEGRPYYQRQAAFLIEPERAIVFSTTSQTDFSVEQTQDWENLLASFQPRVSDTSPANGSEQE
ncbi:DcrB-related protein, partial [Pseudomonas amygdali]